MADKLTRAQMEQVIDNKGSVMLDDGKIVTDKGALPSDVDLAKGDSSAEQAAKDALLAQRAAIDSQLAKLEKAKPKEGEAKVSTVVGGEEGEDEGDDSEADDLESHSVPELKEIARKEEIDLTGVTLKADIIAAIEKARK